MSAAQAQAKQKRQKAKQKAKASQQKASQQKKHDEGVFQKQVGKASDTATSDANAYFTDRGLDPSNPQYADAIQRAIATAKGGIPDLAGNPGSYFANTGENVYNQLTDALRTRSGSSLDALIPQGFENNRITSGMDDQVIQQLIDEARAKAESYSKNLLDRGVVTNTGYNAAEGGINDQEAKIRSLLNDLGTNILAGGRSDLANIANEGRGAAAGLNLGQSFDPAQYASRIDQAFNDFTSGLGDKFRAQAPSSLFDTSGLAALAGAGQGAQNTKFNAKALVGGTGSTEGDPYTDEPRRGNLSIF